MPAPLDWDKLRIFHAVAEAGSFTHAAQSLRLSQSAISRQVSALENDVGVPLFQRHARGLVLTEQGDVLYQTAHNILLKLETVRSALTENSEQPRGRLCITTAYGLGSGWLAKQIPEFLTHYPEITTQLRLDDDELDLTMRHADCAIRLHQPHQPDLIQRRLFDVHMHIYASTSYLAQHGHPKKLSDLDQHRIISFGDPVPRHFSDLNWLETVGRPNGAARRPIFQINNIIAVKRAVVRNMGIALLPDYLAKDKKNFVQLLADCIEPPSFEAFFCYPKTLKNSAKLHAFRDFIFAKAKKWSF